MGPPAFCTKVLIFMKVETTLPLKKEARILQFTKDESLVFYTYIPCHNKTKNNGDSKLLWMYGRRDEPTDTEWFECQKS